MHNIQEIFACDKCHKKMGHTNNMNIVTKLDESTHWSRLHIQITHISGLHNNSTKRAAEMCKNCTLELLRDAIGRISRGERMTAGVQSSEQQGWE